MDILLVGKVVSNLREQNLCTKDEGDRMLAFTNNSGPLFIISFVGISLFGNVKIGLLLLCTHILASITVGIILGKIWAEKRENISQPFSTPLKKSITFSEFGSVLGKSIQNAISTILMIGGFVVIFSVIISILNQSQFLLYASKLLYPILNIFGFDISFAVPILAGIIELTNGINSVYGTLIDCLSQNIVISAFLLGFGGFSVLFQVWGLLSKTDLSIKKYFVGKLLQGFLAAMYTYFALKFIPSLCFNSIPTFATATNVAIYPINFFGVNPYFLLLCTFLFIVCFSFSHEEKKCIKRKRHI